jgi:hypothetical protein
MLNRFCGRFPLWTAVILTLALAWPALPQGLVGGEVELGGSGGVMNARGGGSATKGLAGGGIAVGLGSRGAFYADVGYVPLESVTISGVDGNAPFDVDGSSKLYTFEGGLNIHLGPPDRRAVPYATVGGGIGRGSYKVSATGSGMNFSMSGTETGGIAGGGLGVRLYVGRNWGIKPEFKVQRTFFDGEDITLYRFAAGIFVQFGK